MPIIIGGLGIAFWLRAANVLEPTIGQSKWVNIIADNTYSIMMNQFLGFMAVKTVFAIMSIWTRAFEDFDWFRYKTDIWYYYVPKGIAHTMIIYVMAGLIIPILMQKTMDILKERKYI